MKGHLALGNEGECSLTSAPQYWTLGWSEKHKSGKMQKYQADSKLRHSTDFRTIFGIMIG